MRRLKKITSVSLILMLLWPLCAWGLSAYLVTERRLNNAEAAVVLAGSEDFLERNREAARLYSIGAIPMIILTNDGLRGGWDNALERNPFFVERAKWELVNSGVPENAIVVLQQVVAGDASHLKSGTEFESEVILKHCQASGIRSLIVVTSAFHSRRTLLIFDSLAQTRSGDIKVGLSFPESKSLLPPSPIWWLSLKGWKTVSNEYFKYVGLRFRMWFL